MSDSNRHFRDEKDRPSRRDFLAKGIQSCSVGTVAAWGCMSRNGMAEEDDRRPKLPSWSHSVEDLVNADYQRNTARFGGRLASPIEELLENRPSSSPWQYEVLIVGSGISASVCATPTCIQADTWQKDCCVRKRTGVDSWRPFETDLASFALRATL